MALSFSVIRARWRTVLGTLAVVAAVTAFWPAGPAPSVSATAQAPIPPAMLQALKVGGVNLVFHWYDVDSFKADGFDPELPLIKSSGAGHVRLAISMDAIENGTTGRLRADRWRELKAFVEKAKANGLVTIVDIHNTGQKNPDGSWTHDYMGRIVDHEMQARHLALVEDIAKGVNDEIDRDWVIIGPGNEPLSNAWYGHQDNLMPAIRAKCPDCVVLAMATNWQTADVTMKRLEPRKRAWWDDRFIVDIHMYVPLGLSHCAFPGQPNTCAGKTWPGHYSDHLPTGARFTGLWNRDVLDKALKQLWAWRDKNRVTVHFSEIGTTASLDDGPRSAYVGDVVSILQANGAGWTCWEWHNQFGIKDAPLTKAACLKGTRGTAGVRAEHNSGIERR